ncbi:hypothetical protein [Paractinoplanes maris]|uniref:hypothetical protein n=1 Tax=Paractinoplanes maris TaxID=1734446 RepID=UPI00202106DB|nr:hypothetical protein [Actinoplanes maris]
MIRLTFVGPGVMIENAHGDVGGHRQADHEEEANNALNRPCHKNPAQTPPPAGEFVKPSINAYPYIDA